MDERGGWASPDMRRETDDTGELVSVPRSAKSRMTVHSIEKVLWKTSNVL